MFVDIDGLNINYEFSGEGQIVLLLHGWGGRIESFKPVFEFLAQYYKVYAIDFPGFGNSQIPNEVWGVQDYAQMVKKTIDKLALGKVNIIAHSFGGRVSIVLSAKHPQMVDKLVLVDSAGIIKKRTVKYYVKVYSFKVLKNLYLCFTPKHEREVKLEKFYKKFGSSDYKDAGNLRKIFVKTINEDLKHFLKDIKSETLLIWGENDYDTPVSYGKIMEKEIPDAGLIVFENAGHFSYLDKFNDFCVIVKKFLDTKK